MTTPLPTGPRKNNRGYAKKGTTYHQKKDRSGKKEQDSFKNGWISGLRASLKRGTMSQADFEYAVECYMMNKESPKSAASFRLGVQTTFQAYQSNY